MVSVLQDYSNLKVGDDDTFVNNSEQNGHIETELNTIWPVNHSFIKSERSFTIHNFHRSKDINEEGVFLKLEKESISAVQVKPSKNSFLSTVNDSIVITINFIYNIFIMLEIKFNLLNVTVCQLFDTVQPKSSKKIVKLVFLMMVFVFILVQSRKSHVQHSYETLRFFSQYSLIKDFYLGELSLLKQELQSSDMTFVLYYAPWDRQSQDIKHHFLKAATYHHEQIAFMAINCWLPESECRLHYKLQHFPILVLHIRITTSDETLNVPYSGPLNAHHMNKFLSSALRPYIHVSSQADVLALQLDYQAIALGYYEVGIDNQDFLTFYYAAVSKLQFNHMIEVTYALITNPVLAKMFSFSDVSSIHMILWNTTINYPHHIEKNIRNITHFVDLHLLQVTEWFNINGRKSSSLSNILKGGPFLMIITPDNPYHTSNDPFNILRSVALEYHNCNNSSLLLWLSKYLNLKTRSQLRISDKICRKYLEINLYYESSLYSSFQENYYIERPFSLGQPSNEEICSIGTPNFIQSSWNSLLNYIDIDSQSSQSNSQCLRGDISPYSCLNCSCKVKKDIIKDKLFEEEISGETYMIKDFVGPNEDDTISSLNNWLSEDHCKRLVLGSSLSHPPIIKEENKTLSIAGLRCKTNRTLKFVAVDSLQHEDFIFKLGINHTFNVPKYTGAIIVDPELEERYVLDQPFSRGSLVTFIYNFTNNLLSRSKISHDNSLHLKKCDEGEVCITNLDANNYEEVTQEIGKTFIVLHYSHNCGACSAISHLLLMCMHITSDIANLEYARIDVSSNTLPWHLSFEHVPTIVLHPSIKKSDSRVLDIASPITIQSLMTLISYGLSPSDRLKLALKVCGEKCQFSSTNKSEVEIRKIQLSIDLMNTKYQRYISLLVNTKDNIEKESSFILNSKYDLLISLKSSLKDKLKHLKRKVKHLQSLPNHFPKVPSDFTTLLSYSTFLFNQRSKVS